jgi:hypothetical protein
VVSSIKKIHIIYSCKNLLALCVLVVENLERRTLISVPFVMVRNTRRDIDCRIVILYGFINILTTDTRFCSTEQLFHF